MPPVGDTKDNKSIILEYVNSSKVVIFGKESCPYCRKAKRMFTDLNIEYNYVNLTELTKGEELFTTLKEMYGQNTVPQILISGQLVGGFDSVEKLHSEGHLLPMIAGEIGLGVEVPDGDYDYDLIVIGGGSGGISAAKEAVSCGKKVVCFDFVKPTPLGTTWGLGGTCVNVGCIPKKLMHQAALLGHSIKDATSFGWDIGNCQSATHKWEKMVANIQDYVKSLNFNFRAQFIKKGVKYENAYASFVGPHRVKYVNRRSEEKEMTARYFILATGCRPKYMDIPGCEYCITSDDLFSLPHSPGKTLVVGASYVALECAGFLKSLGLDVTIMVRSILLRGFDQQMADLIGKYMEDVCDIKFLRGFIPTKIEKVKDAEPGKPGTYRVTGLNSKDNGDEIQVDDEYNTILLAIGRVPCTADLNLNAVGVNFDKKSGYIKCNERECTSTPYIFAVGDIVDGRPELTPVAIRAGKLLARRLFAGEMTLCDYINVPTTVFTPLEYGCIGLSEETAIETYGSHDVEVFHSNFVPLEWQVPHHDFQCYAKLVCVKSLKKRVVGLHIAGPNAGEITQGWTVAMKMFATKDDFDSSIGIHPTCAEVFTTMAVTKDSGDSAEAEGC
ncbi:hypothetical protein HELRODRAFT_186760 [Helobdella robusta]|uniref:thioredoxin-disulfide reductase (NADPH) n=1 Tax=Helobdella robusta TaxID=6412 RepID=T1FP31_HELRO|nr:hypothetical protein HELRODRAFT_186760 [Helobdella robusta]ESO08733.1 hypothetical protein HELRODRAFT_186760 [Helobdella robusta]